MSAKFIIKLLAILTATLSVVFNIYIFTYPSLSPKTCSWKDPKASTSQFGKDGCVNQGPLFEKIVSGAKEYFYDVYETAFTDKNKHIPMELSGDESTETVPDLHILAFGDPQIKGNYPSTPYITRLDTFGNDYYLGHIYQTMVKRLDPSHVIVMGDLFSSQWLGDGEFYNRTKRYISRLFPGAIPSSKERIEAVRDTPGKHDEFGKYKADWDAYANSVRPKIEDPNLNFEFGYSDVWRWNEDDPFMFINMTGNHDVGYAGDMTWQHLARWTDLFGKDNFYIEYDLQTDHPWRIVNVNSMLLDGPELETNVRAATWEFLYQVFERNFNGSTILLTHIPFAKNSGLCADGPYFNYYPKEYPNEPYKSGLLRSQNHLSQETSDRVLNLVFHNGKSGIILTGHDHVGCETVYNMYKTQKKTSGYSDAYWECKKDADPKALHHVKEVTVRSMMGDYHGATGLITGHFNGYDWEWSYSLCKFSVQHIWWFTKVVTILAGLFLSLWVVV